MLDFASLETPARHGDVLIAPSPRELVLGMRENASRLRNCEARLLERPLGEWRGEVRRELLGDENRPVIVIGHQPLTIHPGVWAKHIVAHRMAASTVGRAVNLVVDNDAPADQALAVPVVDGQDVSVRHVGVLSGPHGAAYESIAPLNAASWRRIEHDTSEGMGDRFRRCLMPAFLQSAVASDGPGAAGQLAAGRRGVEMEFGIEVQDHLVSQLPFEVLLIDMLLRAAEFAHSYNNALGKYRSAYRVRSPQRPIPDLQSVEGRVEVAAWAYRLGEPRRRLFVKQRGDALDLFGDDLRITEQSIGALQRGNPRSLRDAIAPWVIRPRALTLTLWARLLLADLFIHGIGGAKYDRIADTIISDYYHIEAPRFGCVSATLWLDLPRHPVDAHGLASLEHRRRDLSWNPQRHLSPSGPFADVVDRRTQLAGHARTLKADRSRDTAERRSVFDEIRGLNRLLAPQVEGLSRHIEQERARVSREVATNRVAAGREYFFALYERDGLEMLAGKLPGASDFR